MARLSLQGIKAIMNNIIENLSEKEQRKFIEFLLDKNSWDIVYKTFNNNIDNDTIYIKNNHFLFVKFKKADLSYAINETEISVSLSLIIKILYRLEPCFPEQFKDFISTMYIDNCITSLRRIT